MTIEQNNILSYLAVLKPELEKVGVTKLGLLAAMPKGILATIVILILSMRLILIVLKTR